MTSITVRSLPDKLQKTAIDELNEEPERVAADIAALKAWIRQQPHLRARTDDQFLLSFLRGCKFSLERAKSKIDTFYSMRTRFPEVFSNGITDEDKIYEVLRLGPMLYLPKPLYDDGPRLGIVRQGLCPANKYNFGDIMRVGTLMQEVTLMEDDYATINGVVHIMDMTNVTAAHLFQLTPHISKKMTHWTEEAIPLRTKANHFINTPTGFEPVFNMIKFMFKQKQQDRLYVHGDKLDKLYTHIPQKYLPKEYGGENGSHEVVAKEWEQRFISYRRHFEENIKFGTDESQRAEQTFDYDNLFGVEGSFRKINVD